MTHTIAADMARFHQRYDQRQRLLYVGALSASLVLSAVNCLRTSGGLAAKAAPAMWGFGIAFAPLFIVAWWVAMELVARWRDGLTPPTAEDDARNGVRIANAGFAYSVALMAAVIGSQGMMALASFGVSGGEWIARGGGLAVGAALVCLGNVWPRLRTLPGSSPKAAKAMKINRAWGWAMVIMGLLAVVSALFPHHLAQLWDHRP